jgi:[protein-PII] uridylyltransferase
VRELSPQPAVELGRLAPSLGRTCGDYLERYREAFAESVKRGESGLRSARAYASAMDGLLGALFCSANAAVQAARGPSRGRLALVAVGGYGRGTMGLHSDVDVLFLCDDPGDPFVAALAEALLYPIWDIGIHIGHAVRGVDETIDLARSDIRTATTLIDLRRVGGDKGIVEDLHRRARVKVFEPALNDFLDALQHDTLARHERFGGSLFLLEPEVKQGRGGLRDLDVAEWAARARWDARSVEGYVRTGAMYRREVQDLEAAREMLWRVRNLLHLRAKRQQDRLTFADQEEIAVELGFVDGVTLAVEQFMQAYYRHARVVAQTAERMLDRARRRKPKRRTNALDLGDGTMIFDGHVTVEKTERLADDPALAFRLYRQVFQKQLPPFPFARDAIGRLAADKAFRAKLQSSEEATQLFLWLLTQTGAAPLPRGSVLSELHEVGLLVAMIPEMGPLTGRVHHDVYHVYTVDVHSIYAVDQLRSLARGENPRDLGLASRLLTEAPRPAPLYLAVLLHAIGKARSRDHARVGAGIARQIAERVGLSPVDVEHVVFLVQEQHTLYHFATRRDVHEGDTLRELVRLVGTAERLRDLYLLTVAVLSTTNPQAMTSWKARALEDLYLELFAFFEGEAPTSFAGRAVQVRAEVQVGFVGDADQDELEGFLAQMPDRYLLAHPVDVIRKHARIARDTRERAVAVTVGPGPSEELAEVVVTTRDRPGLLADVAAVLTGHRLSVLGAEIYTRRRDDRMDAFDVFLVTREGRAYARIDASLEAKLTCDLADLLEGRVTAADLLAKNPAQPAWAVRRSPDVPTEVVVDNEASSKFTVVDVFTKDRIGLLHAIARTLKDEGCSIALSKVNTEGQRVSDVFYVEGPEGGKLREPHRLAEIQAALRRGIDVLDASSQPGA